jgi:Tfp pilus assembly PilM family ATPase
MRTDSAVSISEKNVVAVEVGSDWLKVAQIDNAVKAGTLRRVALLRIEAETPEPAAALAAALRTNGFPPGPVIAILPRHLVNIRMLEFPSRDRREIADMVELQVGRQTPYSRDEIIFDFKILGAGREGYSQVMLVIVQSALVRARFALLEEAGVHIARMSISTEGLIQWASGTVGSGADVALLDIDYNAADFCVMRAGQLAFTRNIPVGAEVWKEGDQAAAARFFQEVGRALETYRSEIAGAARIDRLILTGAKVDSVALQERLQAEFGVGVEPRSAWSEAASPEAAAVLEQPEHHAISITALLGVGARPRQLEIDLTPEAVAIRKTLVTRAKHITNFGILLMTLIILAAVFLEGRLARKGVRLDQLRSSVRRTEKEAAAVVVLQRKSAIVAERLNPRLSAVALLNEIQTLVPESIALTALQTEGSKQVVIRGDADSVSDILRFVNTLEASPLLTNVKSANTRTVRDKTEFEIVCVPEN